MNDVYTASFEKWGYMELAEAARMLNIYAEHGQPEFLTDGITLNFNANSGTVFMSDADYNVAVREDEELVQFYSCPQCGYEGTQNTAEADQPAKDFVNNEGFCSAECKAKN